MAGIARFRGLRKVTAPALLQPLEYLKVRIRKDDRQGVIGAPPLEVPGDVDTTFSVEKARRVGNFMAGHCRRSVIGDE
jgi:hypothetical protein